MPFNEHQINSNIIKQVALLAIILFLGYLICSNLSLFIPSVLGAVTMYIICRNFNFYLQEQKHWKGPLASCFLLLVCLVVLIIPLYFIVDIIIVKMGNGQEYIGKFSLFLIKIQKYILTETGFDVLNKDNINKIQELVTRISTYVVSSTMNAITIISSMFFILYFMFDKARTFEQLILNTTPLKRANIVRIGDKFQKLVIANAVGIPVVAIGQGLVALLGYYLFRAPSPMFLFALTIIGSMIPIVGAAIIYVPVCLFMVAESDNNGIFLAIYCLVVVGLTDNVMRFTLLKKLEDIHPLTTVFGIIMGINLFGFMGLVFGPIMLSITILLIQVYIDEFVNSSAFVELNQGVGHRDNDKEIKKKEDEENEIESSN